MDTTREHGCCSRGVCVHKQIKALDADNARIRAALAAAEAKLARVVEDMRWFADPENYRHPRPESTSPGPNVLVDGLQIASAALAEIEDEPSTKE